MPDNDDSGLINHVAMLVLFGVIVAFLVAAIEWRDWLMVTYWGGLMVAEYICTWKTALD